MTEPVRAAPDAGRRDGRILRLARWTVPIHVLLPCLFAALHRHTGVLVGLFLGFHLAFPVLLVATWSRWRGHGEEVAFLVVVNHVVTFTTFAVLALVFVP
jgi:hypothetical protein